MEDILKESILHFIGKMSMFTSIIKIPTFAVSFLYIIFRHIFPSQNSQISSRYIHTRRNLEDPFLLFYSNKVHLKPYDINCYNKSLYLYHGATSTHYIYRVKHSWLTKYYSQSFSKMNIVCPLETIASRLFSYHILILP